MLEGGGLLLDCFATLYGYRHEDKVSLTDQMIYLIEAWTDVASVIAGVEKKCDEGAAAVQSSPRTMIDEF